MKERRVGKTETNQSEAAYEQQWTEGPGWQGSPGSARGRTHLHHSTDLHTLASTHATKPNTRAIPILGSRGSFPKKGTSISAAIFAAPPVLGGKMTDSFWQEMNTRSKCISTDAQHRDLAVGTNEATHVFNNAENWNLDLQTPEKKKKNERHCR